MFFYTLTAMINLILCIFISHRKDYYLKGLDCNLIQWNPVLYYGKVFFAHMVFLYDRLNQILQILLHQVLVKYFFIFYLIYFSLCSPMAFFFIAVISTVHE